MTNPTSNFGWQMPTATDLVTDLPADFAVFGQAVDTSMADLKGGTTGQVLAKATATDMDFTWVTTDDTNAIQNAIVDAKGDLIAASAADTPARLAVGTNGQILQADSTTATGLKWATPASGAYTLISTTSLTGASVTLSSIPQTYKDLRLILVNPLNATDGNGISMQVNGQTGTNYANQTYSNTNAAVAISQTKARIAADGDNGSNPGQTIVDIVNYTNSTTYKLFNAYGLTLDAAGSSMVITGSIGCINQTTAISSITVMPNAGNFTSGTALLYGAN